MDGLDEHSQKALAMRRGIVYDEPKHCAIAIRCGMDGQSLVQIAAEIGIHRQNLNRWRDQHPEFNDACAIAQVQAQAWWERKGQDFVVEVPDAPRLNSAVWQRVMLSRFKEDYTERKEITGANGEPLGNGKAEPVQIMIVDPQDIKAGAGGTDGA